MVNNDGGPAFPVIDPDVNALQSTGMSLRDYLAAKAMQGIISASNDGGAVDYDEEVVARYAYLMADAMIAERKK